MIFFVSKQRLLTLMSSKLTYKSVNITYKLVDFAQNPSVYCGFSYFSFYSLTVGLTPSR